ncbi:MAG TPA: hypothetical protein VJJ98_03035 [Sedimentisphaerales bacterium]|nr:hypothetical protein [Sedimentisphaerales bacterium]
MKPKHPNAALILSLAFAITCLLADSEASAEFRAAITVRNVTPDPLLPVSGGIGPSKRASQKLGELTVRALVFEEGTTRVAICSTDFLGFPGVLCEKVRGKVSGIPSENILIGATHTHSAPDCYGFPDRAGKTSADLKYLDSVCSKLADAINQAVSDLQPASIKIATGRAKGKIAYNYYAEQLYDQRCDVIQALDLEAKPIATLVNYACHPEVIGSEQGVLSPDFVGPLYDRIEQRIGGAGIFMNGALGGMVTADCRGPDGKDIQTWDECIRIGHLLGGQALNIIADAPIQTEPKLTCTGKTVKFPVENEVLRAVMTLSPLGFAADENGCVSARVNLVSVGDAQILTIPGEALPNIGFYLKRKMHGRHNLLFGLTNDAFGYMLTKVDYGSFDRYDYITRTSLGEMTGEIFIKEALSLLDSPH